MIPPASLSPSNLFLHIQDDEITFCHFFFFVNGIKFHLSKQYADTIFLTAHVIFLKPTFRISAKKYSCQFGELWCFADACVSGVVYTEYVEFFILTLQINGEFP